MKKSKNKNEKGSAIILAILLLAFFMALTMSMYFLAEKKAEMAGLKSKGTKELASIDSGTSIAYYEMGLASMLQKTGIIDRGQNYDISGMGANAGDFETAASGNITFDVAMPGGGNTTNLILQALTISDYTDYFSTRLLQDYDGRKDSNEEDILFTSINDIRIPVDINGTPTIAYQEEWHGGMLTTQGALNSIYEKRMWHTGTTEGSIGGYKLTSGQVDITTGVIPRDETATYQKEIVLNEDANTSAQLAIRAIGEFRYVINVTETARISNGTAGRIVESDITDFIIEKQ
jgi:hypothetical protein